MIGPGVSVTSNMVGKTLQLICKYTTHDPRLHIGCPPYASMCTLGLSKASSHSLLKYCCALWSGMMLQPAPVSTSHSVLAMLEFGDCESHSGQMRSVSLLWM